jgi:hypothetical protein
MMNNKFSLLPPTKKRTAIKKSYGRVLYEVENGVIVCIALLEAVLDFVPWTLILIAASALTLAYIITL